MRAMIFIVATIIAAGFIEGGANAFEWHCSNTSATITLDVRDTLGPVQEGELYGSLLAEHPAIKQHSVTMRCAPQGSESATLLRCTPVKSDLFPLIAYIFRGNRPEWPRLFARVYINNQIFEDLMSCPR